VGTNEQAAVDCVKESERLQKIYLGAIDAFNTACEKQESAEVQKRLLTEMHRAGTDAFNAVDTCISKSDQLGANRSRLWAVDLATTSFNTLESILLLYERLQEEADRLAVSRPNPSGLAFYQMQSATTIFFPRKARLLRQQFAKLSLPIEGFDNPTPMNTRYKNWEKIFMTATVVGFVLILLAIGVFMKPKDLNNFNIFLFRTVLSFVGAAFGAIFVPGAIRIRKFGVTAAGAAAFFVIIFFCNPPALVKNTLQPEPPSAASPSATP
jgi:hypothetical protein